MVSIKSCRIPWNFFLVFIWGEYCYAQKLCVDSDDNVDGSSISCAFISNNENKANKYCGNAKLQSACPVACGTCCKDDESYRLKLSKSKKSCQWIGQTRERKNKWCDKSNNGRSVRKACPMTCGECCADDTEYIFLQEKAIERKCKWLKTQNRKDKWCDEFSNGSFVRNACRIKCGECCADDSDYFFEADGRSRKCQWLSNQSRKKKWCDVLSNGSIVRNACRVKCRECCAEDLDYSFPVEGEKKTCRWLSSQKKRDKWCDNWKIMKACPIRCGDCCADDPDYNFIRNGIDRDCQYLSRLSPDIRDMICNQFNKGKIIRNTCKETCGMCDDDLEIPTISPVPTSGPSITGFPTSSSPTSSPSTSVFPTSSSPTSSPSTSVFPTSSSPTSSPSISSLPTSSPTKSRPNIIIILADDVGVGDIEGYWDDDSMVTMPHITNLMSNGTKFMNAHSTPLCAPSRYILLSGNYQFRGLKKWKLQDSNSFIKDQMSIAELLKTESNYHTAAIGKWHLGAKIPPNGLEGEYNHILSNPNHNFTLPVLKGTRFLGFESSFISMSGIQNPPYAFFRNDYLDTNSIKFWHKGTYNMPHGNSTVSQDGEGAQDWDSTAHDTILVNETKDFLDDHINNRADDPFFLYFASAAVHVPHTPPNKFLNGEKVANQYPTGHMDMLSQLDMTVGALTESLEERGLLQNTIIVLTSDNGGIGGKHGSKQYGHNSSGKLRGSKGSPYEGGHRVPFIMRYDGVIPAGNKEDSLIGLNDLYATLCDIVNVEIPQGQALDSISFADLIINKRKKYKRRKHLGIWRDKKRDLRNEVILTPKFKLIHHLPNTTSKHDTFELYNMVTDRSETTDLSSDVSYKKLIKNLRKKLSMIRPSG